MAKSSVITEEFQAIQTALEALEPLNEVQRKFAVTMILSRLGMSEMQAGQNATPGGDGSRAPKGAVGVAGQKGTSVRDFMKQKAPQTDLERFVCLAYYLTHLGETPSFTTRDITKLNAEAHGIDFSNPAATAMNAVKQSRLLSRAGGGKKRITTRGESLVEALPDRAKVKEVVRSTPHRRNNKAGAAKRKSAK